MNKIFYLISLLTSLQVSPAVSAVVDPSATSREISTFVAKAKPDAAVAAIESSLAPMPSVQYNLEQLRAALSSLTKSGPADVNDEISVKKYGQSIQIVTYYLYFPNQDVPENHFLFLRYTFMSDGSGWIMTSFDLKTSGKFPVPGWGD
ncbi:hypothetical protein [Rhizobium alvei]|uniref:DUF3887 domain-containing protein n=1 Tax=Rhizobium alvei TaxID=1132659 RepID=A0ABT8YJ14_9HYPH|nr:hypothetical protein [Rhizobium alvei]MDO6963691.1 hypothetical protein [Rhizobium alvei]